jgi:hypothetical protein
VWYFSRMTKPTDGRTKRAEVRRLVYAHAARTMAETAPARPPALADTVALAALYYMERRRLLEWLRARGRGVLRSPPGGVGRADK